MTDLFRLPTDDELDQLALHTSLAEGMQHLVQGMTSKRGAVLRLVGVCVAVLAYEKGETAQFAAMIDYCLKRYREGAGEPDDSDAVQSAVTTLLAPGVQAALDRDPKLKAAFGGVKETLETAMRGVKEGRYPSFDAAMEALTGQKPEPLSAEDLEAFEELEATFNPPHPTKQ